LAGADVTGAVAPGLVAVVPVGVEVVSPPAVVSEAAAGVDVDELPAASGGALSWSALCTVTVLAETVETGLPFGVASLVVDDADAEPAAAEEFSLDAAAVPAGSALAP
jgi:hypothetical protein